MRFLMLPAAAALVATGALQAQDSLPARPVISIGNYPSVNGLRLNFRDSNLGRVNGVNVTIWSPNDPATGTVKGLALGLPLTGAATIDGVATGVLGIGASESINGVMFAPIGAGAGQNIAGIAIGGVGIGTGGDLKGFIVGGVGAGAGGNARGILIGGVGAGVGGSIRGFVFGGVGAGAGGDVVGLAIGGVGIGAGGSIRGVAIAGIGVGAPRLSGGFVALAAGASDARGVVLAPALFRIERDGSFTGVSASAVNYIRGSQSGLTIGLVNYTRTLKGVQLGVINIVSEAKSHSVMPILNWGSGRE